MKHLKLLIDAESYFLINNLVFLIYFFASHDLGNFSSCYFLVNNFSYSILNISAQSLENHNFILFNFDLSA